MHIWLFTTRACRRYCRRQCSAPIHKQTLNGGDYLVHYSMPNFYFHVTIAYDILRNNGLEIGKSDFMGDA
jgi:hypothetical protein